MRQENVERIVVTNMFVTTDNEKFEFYEDALSHELNFLSELDELKCFNGNGERVRCLDCVETVYLGTSRAAEVFIEWHKYEGFHYDGLCETSLGWYFWNDYSWISPEEELKRARERINEQLEKCGGVPIE